MPLLAALILWVSCVAPGRAVDTGITSRDFGPCAEGVAHLYTLTNAHGWCLRITDYGATVVSVITPDRQGHLDDIALGFDSPTDYRVACKQGKDEDEENESNHNNFLTIISGPRNRGAVSSSIEKLMPGWS